MQRFTIRDIENMCGIKAHTLRIWESRYDFFKAQRKNSQHRFYDNEDLKKLLRVAYLYHGGWKISKIAALSESDLNNAINSLPVSGAGHELTVIKMLDLALGFEEARFQELLRDTIDRIGMPEAITRVCYPFLNRIGLLWMTSNIIPAQEHFSSYLIQHKIIAATDGLPPAPANAPLCILFTPPGEHHELPLLFIQYMLRHSGWATIYFGAGRPPEELPAKLLEQDPLLYLHLITNFTGSAIDDYLETICRLYPGHTIVASGKAVQDAQRSFLNLRILRSDEEIYNFIANPPYLGTT